MVRRVLHFLALALLVLASPARGLFLPGGGPQGCCCCGEAGEPGPGPCGMPKAPCAPSCPASGAAQGVLAPMVAAARAQAVQAEETSPRREPAPWPEALAGALRPAPLPVPAAHGPPLPRFGNPQAGLATFRI